MSDKKEKLSVCLSGGGPWGFRLQGGAGTGLPLIVSKVRRKSKAHKRLLEGDLILSVNGHSCQNLTYDQVMEIADKSGTDLTLEILRQESNKENLVPSNCTSTESLIRTSSPLKTMENGSVTKEIISLSESSSKVTEEKEGMRIKSATLLPANVTANSADNILEKFTSQKLSEDFGKQEVKENKPVDSFPLFSELLQTPQGPPKPPRSPVDTSTSSKTEEIKNDDNTFTKTVTETKHEIKGNTEMSFTKKEQESVSKNVVERDCLSPVTLEAIDLNNLINATQKKLESFKHGLLTDIPVSEALPSIYDVKKTELTTSTSVSETKSSETFSSLNQSPFSIPALDSTKEIESKVQPKQNEFEKKVPPPIPPKPKNRPLSDPLPSSFNDCLKEMQMDLFNGGLGFTTNESSTEKTETPFGSTIITKKKKMFSSSSFYEEPGAVYPTLEEQVEMARKIADSLADDTNKKSKGSNMFYKRLKKSSKWVHEGPEPSDESGPGTPEVQGVEPPTPDISQVPFRPSKGPPKLKLVLDPRHPLDAAALRSSGLAISEHNVVSPEVCHGLVKDLQSPVGKGAALFAKRKKKSEEWVVDEEKVKAMLRENERKITPISQTSPYNQYSTLSRQDVKLIKSPWEAAMESPYGFCDAAFARVNPDHLADTVIKAAETKRRNSNTPTVSREPSRMEGCLSPPIPMTPAAAQHDIYHAKAPRGWMSTERPIEPSYQPEIFSPLPNIPERSVLPQNGFSTPKKMVFHNFNTVPRQWKPTVPH